MPEPSRPYAVGCVLRNDRGGSSTLGSAWDDADPARVSVVAAGSIISETVAEGDGGAGLRAADLGVSGILGGLVEVDTSVGGAGVLFEGGAGMSAAPCTPPATSRLVVAGGSTRSREGLELVVFNPYGVDAVVEVQLGSEAGTESIASLESLVVPARTTLIWDLGRLVALRESLAVTLDVSRGAVHAALVETGGNDTMLLDGAEPAPAWWVLLPPYTLTPGRVVVADADAVSVDVRIDTFGADGVRVGAREETLAVGEQVSIAAAELGPAVGGVAVTGSGDLAVAAVFDGAGFRGGGAGASRLAPAWFLGPATDLATVWVLVPGDVDATVEVEIPGSPSAPLTLGAPAGTLSRPRRSGEQSPATLCGRRPRSPSPARLSAARPSPTGSGFPSMDEIAVPGLVAGAVVLVAAGWAAVGRSGGAFRRRPATLDGLEAGVYLFTSETCDSCPRARAALVEVVGAEGFREIAYEDEPETFARLGSAGCPPSAGRDPPPGSPKASPPPPSPTVGPGADIA